MFSRSSECASCGGWADSVAALGRRRQQESNTPPHGQARLAWRRWPQGPVRVVRRDECAGREDVVPCLKCLHLSVPRCCSASAHLRTSESQPRLHRPHCRRGVVALSRPHHPPLSCAMVVDCRNRTYGCPIFCSIFYVYIYGWWPFFGTWFSSIWYLILLCTHSRTKFDEFQFWFILVLNSLTRGSQLMEYGFFELDRNMDFWIGSVTGLGSCLVHLENQKV